MLAIRTAPKETPGTRLIKAAKEAVAVAKGESAPAAVYVPPPKPTARPEVSAYAEKIAALPDLFPAKQPKRTGRPSSGKIVVSLRLDPDVIAEFRATGPGWQARINEALKASLTRS